jgi:uncharacterized membrane protein (DUF2068 family)
MTRPTGVSIIAILSLISGLLGLCGVSPLFAIGAVGAIIPTGITQIVGGLLIVVGALLVIGPILQIIFAYGAWNLRAWAWWLGIIATGISVLGVIVGILGSGGAAIPTVVTNALLPIVIFLYLLVPDIRKAFRV